MLVLRLGATLSKASAARENTYDLEGVGNDTDGHELLSVVAAVHHQRVGETLNDGAVGLAEALGGIATGGVGDIDGVAEGDIVTVRKQYSISTIRSFSAAIPRLPVSPGFVNVRQGHVADLDIVVPLVEELDIANLLDNILGEDADESRVLDLDIAAFRHIGQS